MVTTRYQEKRPPVLGDPTRSGKRTGKHAQCSTCCHFFAGTRGLAQHQRRSTKCPSSGSHRGGAQSADFSVQSGLPDASEIIKKTARPSSFPNHGELDISTAGLVGVRDIVESSVAPFRVRQVLHDVLLWDVNCAIWHFVADGSTKHGRASRSNGTCTKCGRHFKGTRGLKLHWRLSTKCPRNPAERAESPVEDLQQKGLLQPTTYSSHGNLSENDDTLDSYPATDDGTLDWMFPPLPASDSLGKSGQTVFHFVRRYLLPVLLAVEICPEKVTPSVYGKTGVMISILHSSARSSSGPDGSQFSWDAAIPAVMSYLNDVLELFLKAVVSPVTQALEEDNYDMDQYCAFRRQFEHFCERIQPVVEHLYATCLLWVEDKTDCVLLDRYSSFKKVANRIWCEKILCPGGDGDRSFMLMLNALREITRFRDGATSDLMKVKIVIDDYATVSRLPVCITAVKESAAFEKWRTTLSTKLRDKFKEESADHYKKLEFEMQEQIAEMKRKRAPNRKPYLQAMIVEYANIARKESILCETLFPGLDLDLFDMLGRHLVGHLSGYVEEIKTILSNKLRSNDWVKEIVPICQVLCILLPHYSPASLEAHFEKILVDYARIGGAARDAVVLDHVLGTYKETTGRVDGLVERDTVLLPAAEKVFDKFMRKATDVVPPFNVIPSLLAAECCRIMDVRAHVKVEELEKWFSIIVFLDDESRTRFICRLIGASQASATQKNYSRLWIEDCLREDHRGKEILMLTVQSEEDAYKETLKRRSDLMEKMRQSKILSRAFQIHYRVDDFNVKVISPWMWVAPTIDADIKQYYAKAYQLPKVVRDFDGYFRKKMQSRVEFRVEWLLDSSWCELYYYGCGSLKYLLKASFPQTTVLLAFDTRSNWRIAELAQFLGWPVEELRPVVRSLIQGELFETEINGDPEEELWTSDGEPVEIRLNGRFRYAGGGCLDLRQFLWDRPQRRSKRVIGLPEPEASVETRPFQKRLKTDIGAGKEKRSL